MKPAKLCSNQNKHQSHTWSSNGVTYWCPGKKS